MIDVYAAAQLRARSSSFTDRTWLAVELWSLIERDAWPELGGLLVHVALAVAPVVALPARLAEAQALPPRSAELGPALWADDTWIGHELALHVEALTSPDSDLSALALRAAGVVARIGA